MGMGNLPGSSICCQKLTERSGTEAAGGDERKNSFSILFGLGVKYILLHITRKGGEKVCKRMYDVVNLS